ncbi:MAG: nitroreductase/quinone reductase family protein [Gordonia sp. (in: high G+C Gram-positive bacteria)]|uniref:nitroreductase/quinone reductase family protein n=1 Tax=Gordonia sp. (in: high G+C Gram-positive bacteria) TaxID=84139 RepID=UPI0039E2DAC0
MADKPARIPPPWFIKAAWKVHRGLYRLSGGRFGLWEPRGTEKWGTLRLTTVGRRTGAERSVILAYFPDGENLALMAMNGWQEGAPAWWLNLQAQPDARVTLVTGERDVRARAAVGDERERLWSRWQEFDHDLDELAGRRATDTAVVVLEPR